MFVDCNTGVVKRVCCSLFLISDISIQFMQVTQENAPLEKYAVDFPIASVPHAHPFNFHVFKGIRIQLDYCKTVECVLIWVLSLCAF